MMPIRRGDGTGLSVPGFSEVRKGDGTVLWSAGADIPDSVVNRWPIDEGSGSTIADVEGSADGSFVGSPTWVSDGNYIGDHYLDFDGTDDGVDTGATSASGALTMLATVVVGSDITSIQHITSWYDEGNPGERVLWFRGDQATNQIEWRIANDSGTLQTVQYTLPSQGTYRIAGVLDSASSEQRLGVNGTIEATGSISGSFSSTLSNHTLGFANTERYLNAGIDDPMNADGAYSASQVQDDYDRQPWS